MYLQLSITHCIVIKYLPPKFNVMFKFNYPKYNHRGFIFGGGLIHGWAYYRNFTVPWINSNYVLENIGLQFQLVTGVCSTGIKRTWTLIGAQTSLSTSENIQSALI